jgi:hypothetical protein
MTTPWVGVRLLEFDRPWRLPWLSVELAEREMKIQEYEEDAVAIFTDSLEELPECNKS